MQGTDTAVEEPQAQKFVKLNPFSCRKRGRIPCVAIDGEPIDACRFANHQEDQFASRIVRGEVGVARDGLYGVGVGGPRETGFTVADCGNQRGCKLA